MSNEELRDDPLAVLRAFERLEVGPIALERDRLTVPYRVVAFDREATTELVYKYSEPVFDPNEAASRNLAAVIGAQIALNYGLFCDRIVFHGAYDHVDRRLLNDMAENTAREIYVKKFLQPNPFLTGEAAELAAVRLRRYLRSKLEFPDAARERATTDWSLWPMSKTRHAISSSGGKDSLLTFGLMRELGREAHPIFMNESGRHWYTALNAHRHFEREIDHTSRVWVNSDRVFAWFLRQLPFVRRDFADRRSDEYPIRLWTVAVFTFGAIPLLRKHGIGRLLIGDEFDTTVRTSMHGVTHYDGLYDQSRYFDNVMSRYFMRKGWSISQFSILRPLSELLIQKILAERYPELQSLQMSCHAAHTEDGRALPCGRCEKCRRIVGMLAAIDADPTRCGYTTAQVDACLAKLAERGVHQEAAGAAHLDYTLARKGLIELPPNRKRQARAHPEIEKLRFDGERSPLDTIPNDLRAPLYRIYLAHADGAVQRQRRAWVEIDPLAPSSLDVPFPFEGEVRTRATSDTTPATPSITGDAPSRYLWGELTWPDAEARLKEVDIALLPVGSIEQHGPHLPVDTDAFDADYLARRVAEACSDPKPLVLPLIPYGVSYHHDDFKGTISISNAALAALVYDIGMSVARNGINKLIIINGHGGNTPTLNDAAQRINKDAHIFVCVESGETSDVDIEKLTETPNDVHAGEVETSTTLAIRPDLVRMDRVRKVVPRFSSRYLSFTSQRGVSWYAPTKRLSPSGVMGDPTRATVEKGRQMWEVMIAHLVALTEDLKGTTLEGLYQRRY